VVCNVRCVECDFMVCVFFDLLSGTVWCVYSSLCLVRLYVMFTLRCVKYDFMLCVLFGMLSSTVWCVSSSVY